MLIPQECHKPSFQVQGPVVNTSWVPTTVASAKESYSTREREEKERRRRRQNDEHPAEEDDDFDLSVEVAEQGVGPTFSALLSGLADAY